MTADIGVGDAATPESPARRASPGRPKPGVERDVYLQLLQAAEASLSKGTYASIRVRDVAAAAGVNPAMVNYYFGSKLGLFAALIRVVYGDWLRAIEQIRRNVADPERDPPAEIAAAIFATFGTYPGVVQLLRREFVDASSTLRINFVENFGSRSAATLRRLLSAGIAAGRFDAEIDVRYVAYVINAVAVAPFALGTDLPRAFAIEPGELRGEAWREFLTRVIRGMVGTGGVPGIDSAATAGQ